VGYADEGVLERAHRITSRNPVRSWLAGRQTRQPHAAGRGAPPDPAPSATPGCGCRLQGHLAQLAPLAARPARPRAPHKYMRSWFARHGPLPPPCLRPPQAKELREGGQEPYAYRFDRTHYTEQLQQQYEALAPGEGLWAVRPFRVGCAIAHVEKTRGEYIVQQPQQLD
jgi:hypothetical protein